MERALYGSPSFREATGGVLRPGGLELTAHGLALMQESGLPSRGMVFDAGCGPGKTASFLARLGYRVMGLDWHPGPSSAEMGDSAPMFVTGDLEHIPLVDGCCDAVVAECVLSLVNRLDEVLAGFARVLREGGLLLVTDLTLRPGTPALSGDECRQSPYLGKGASCLGGAMAPRDWEAAFTHAGFAPVVREDHSHALALLMARLVWYDAADELDWLLPGGENRCSAEFRRRFGYELFLSRKMAS